MRLLPRMPLVGHWISGAAVALATAAVLWTGLLAGVDRALGDALQRFGSRHPPALPMGVPDVALLALDPQSLRAFPDWPWPRRLYGDAIRRLDAAGAVAIGFDIDFSTPRSHEDDEHFAAAVRESGHVVLAAFRQSQEAAPEVEVEVSSTPIPALRESAAAVGSVLVPLDPDGVVRRAPHTSEIGAEPTPSLAAAVLALAMREREIPVREGDFPVDYRRVNPPFPVLSMVDVVEGRFDPRNVAGRAVFVGATAAEFQDLWSVPLGPAKPGVVIQALAYRTLAAQAGASAVLAPLNPFSRSRGILSHRL